MTLRELHLNIGRAGRHADMAMLAGVTAVPSN
jgi:hypothetical protein